MAYWAVIIPSERYQTERLYHHDTLKVCDGFSADGRSADGGWAGAAERGVSVPAAGAALPAAGDDVLVVTAGPAPAVVALGRVTGGDGASAPLHVGYTRRLFDAPCPVTGLALDRPVCPVDPGTFQAITERITPPPQIRTWLVSLDLPIEAESPAEAVRRFWSYVRQLGPRELPTFVAPTDDELAMQAFVLGDVANLDPEEDGDDD